MGVEAIKEAHEEPETEYAEDSLTADLAAAWSEADIGEEDESIQPESEQGGAGEDDTLAEATSDEVLPEPVQAENTGKAGAEAKPEDGETPPVGLPPAAREVWKDTPKAMKEAIAKREHDFATGIQRYAENAKRAEGMDRVLQPYQQYLAMNGGPAQTINTLLQTGAGLQMGTPIQKAQMMAGLIQQFGVDIQALDQLLVGQTPREKPENQFNQLLDQRLAPLQQKLSQYEQREHQLAQQAQAKVAEEVNSFGSTHEFYNDVRSSMADALDLAAQRGQEMSMEQAYNLACQMHPQISQILATRKAAPTAGQRRAASSITGTKGGEGGTDANASLRASIEQAWESAGRD